MYVHCSDPEFQWSSDLLLIFLEEICAHLLSVRVLVHTVR